MKLPNQPCCQATEWIAGRGAKKMVVGLGGSSVFFEVSTNLRGANMSGKIITGLLAAGILFAAGCSSGNEWKGKIKGKMKLEKWIVSNNTSEVVAEGDGSAKLEYGMKYRVIMGGDTFLPDCNLVFDPPVGSESKMTEKNRVFKGEAGAGGEPCRGIVWKDKPPVDIYFDTGSVVSDDYGGYTLFISYRPLSDNSEYRTLRLNGEKAGWF